MTRKVILTRAIKDAVAKGDVDKALKLLDEAERLGSKSARSTFISSVKGKGKRLPALLILQQLVRLPGAPFLSFGANCYTYVALRSLNRVLLTP